MKLSSNKAITLYSADAELLPVKGGFSGFLFECASDSLAACKQPEAIRLTQLIGDFEESKLQAYNLAQKLLIGEPKFRNLKQLGIFEELVIRILQKAYHVLNLHQFLVTQGFTQCHFAGESEFASGLAALVKELGTNLEVTAPTRVQPSNRWRGLQRSWQRVLSAGFTKRAVAREWHQVLERLDPYHRRERLKSRYFQRNHNAIWFYTTANTFTRIGQYYEPYFPKAFEYLIENPQTGGEPLMAARRPFTSVYAFGEPYMEPSTTELQAAQMAIVRQLKEVCLSSSESLARQFLLASSFFQTFLTRHLPRGLYATTMFEHWVDAVRPSALVVGNPVFEGYALHAAKLQGIPTILLQHGILGDYCQLIDPPVDHYVVRGSFWRDFLALSPRGRAQVLEPPPQCPATKSEPVSRDAILFLTTPYGMQLFKHFTDLKDILLALLEVASKGGRELIIRVHPLEEVGFYQEKISQWIKTGGLQVTVTYSQGAGLDELLSRAAVAVTYCSTVFLDCLRHRVPIVSFGWHDFSFKKQIEAHGVFHFATDLTSLSKLIQRSLQGDLPAYEQSTKPFLAVTHEEEIRKKLENLTQSETFQERRANT